MKPSEVLTKAKALIDTPEKWTQKAFARDLYGTIAATESERAVRFCAGGAIGRASGFTRQGHSNALTALQDVVGRIRIAHWNDAPERTHADVMAAFDKAIALSQTSGARLNAFPAKSGGDFRHPEGGVPPRRKN